MKWVYVCGVCVFCVSVWGDCFCGAGVCDVCVCGVFGGVLLCVVCVVSVCVCVCVQFLLVLQVFPLLFTLLSYNKEQKSVV